MQVAWSAKGAQVIQRYGAGLEQLINGTLDLGDDVILDLHLTNFIAVHDFQVQATGPSKESWALSKAKSKPKTNSPAVVTQIASSCSSSDPIYVDRGSST